VRRRSRMPRRGVRLCEEQASRTPLRGVRAAECSGDARRRKSRTPLRGVRAAECSGDARRRKVRRRSRTPRRGVRLCEEQASRTPLRGVRAAECSGDARRRKGRRRNRTPRRGVRLCESKRVARLSAARKRGRGSFRYSRALRWSAVWPEVRVQSSGFRGFLDPFFVTERASTLHAPRSTLYAPRKSGQRQVPARSAFDSRMDPNWPFWELAKLRASGDRPSGPSPTAQSEPGPSFRPDYQTHTDRISRDVPADCQNV
jgi:hypothetical protein